MNIETIGTCRNQVGTNLEPNGTSLCMEELGDGFSFLKPENSFEVVSLRSLRTFECHCVLRCTTLLRRRVTELSNLCGLAQVRAVKKSCHAALVFSQVSSR